MCVCICMYAGMYVRHTCTYALDTALMRKDTYRYGQIDADTGICISHIHCAYVICIAVSCAYVCAYVCCMCFTDMHIYQSICVLYVLHIHAHMHWQDHRCTQHCHSFTALPLHQPSISAAAAPPQRHMAAAPLHRRKAPQQHRSSAAAAFIIHRTSAVSLQHCCHVLRCAAPH
jgi:hypothetical protein